MAIVWTGTVQLKDGGPDLQDICLINRESEGSFTLGNETNLEYLALVAVANVPFYIVSGPRLDLQTDNDCSTAWLTRALCSKVPSRPTQRADERPWWESTVRQSTHGILIKINENVHSGKRNATELLFYAACEGSDDAEPSDHEAKTSEAGTARAIKIFAVPLCSDLLKHAQHSTRLGSLTANLEGPPQYVTLNPSRGIAKSHRQSMSDLFEDATQQRKKLKGRGGESMSRVMANMDDSGQSHRPGSSLPSNISEKPDSDIKRHNVSEATTNQRLVEASRGHSRSTSVTLGRQSSLHLVENATAIDNEDITAATSESHHTSQNRSTLSKIVMAGMRLHGFEQRKKADRGTGKPTLSRSVSLASGMDNLRGDADEYKLIYHQTTKAAMFSLRGHWNSRHIRQEVMRDTVDRLLDLFCTDPVTEYAPIEDVGASTGKYETQDAHGFDLPSFGGPAESEILPRELSKSVTRKS